MADKTFHTRLINMRRDLHEHPELSFQEVETTKKSAAGEEEQIEILDVPQLETGVIAEIKGQEDGPVIAIRADIDALPIQNRRTCRLHLRLMAQCMRADTIFIPLLLLAQRFY